VGPHAAPGHPHDIDCEGMLLYATVDETNFHHKFTMSVATVNLAREWQEIEARLLEVVGFKL